MDIKKTPYFATMANSSNSEVKRFNGTIHSLLMQIAQSLIALRLRPNSDGLKAITITISNRDGLATTVDESVKLGQIQTGLAEQISGKEIVPTDDDTFESFYDRLLLDGLTVEAATMIAGDWFNVPTDPNILNWLSDAKAIRFRQLNASHNAAANANPDEYKQLQTYCLHYFKGFVDRMTLRK